METTSRRFTASRLGNLRSFRTYIDAYKTCVRVPISPGEISHSILQHRRGYVMAVVLVCFSIQIAMRNQLLEISMALFPEPVGVMKTMWPVPGVNDAV